MNWLYDANKLCCCCLNAVVSALPSLPFNTAHTNTAHTILTDRQTSCINQRPSQRDRCRPSTPPTLLLLLLLHTHSVTYNSTQQTPIPSLTQRPHSTYGVTDTHYVLLLPSSLTPLRPARSTHSNQAHQHNTAPFTSITRAPFSGHSVIVLLFSG